MRIAKAVWHPAYNTACYATDEKTVLSVNDPDHIPLVPLPHKTTAIFSSGFVTKHLLVTAATAVAAPNSIASPVDAHTSRADAST